MVVDEHVFWLRGVRQIVDAKPNITIVAEVVDRLTSGT
jgi:hypothetical protein